MYWPLVYFFALRMFINGFCHFSAISLNSSTSLNSTAKYRLLVKVLRSYVETAWYILSKAPGSGVARVPDLEFAGLAWASFISIAVRKAENYPVRVAFALSSFALASLAFFYDAKSSSRILSITAESYDS